MAETPLGIAPAVVSGEVVQALEEMLADAKAAQLVGIAWVAIYTGSRYEVDVAGEGRSAPACTRGYVAVLDDELSKLIHGTENPS